MLLISGDRKGQGVDDRPGFVENFRFNFSQCSGLLPKIGAALTAGKTFGTVESVKAVSDLYAPVSGTVTAINEELSTSPEKVNSLLDRLYDRLDVRAYGCGGDPYSTLHLDMKKAKWYVFNADYRDIVFFDALPSYADPMLARRLGATGRANVEQRWSFDALTDRIEQALLHSLES